MKHLPIRTVVCIMCFLVLATAFFGLASLWREYRLNIALCGAASTGNVRATGVLLRSGADPNAVVPRYAWSPQQNWCGNSSGVPGATPLVLAAESGSCDTVAELVSAGADVNHVV